MERDAKVRQLVAMRHVGHTRKDLQSSVDKPAAPEVIEANQKIPVKYFRGIKVCSSKKVTGPTAY